MSMKEAELDYFINNKSCYWKQRRGLIISFYKKCACYIKYIQCILYWQTKFFIQTRPILDHGGTVEKKMQLFLWGFYLFEVIFSFTY